MLNKETTVGLTIGQIIAICGLIFALVGAYTNVQVQIASIRTDQVTEKEKLSTYVQQNFNDHRGMYIDFKGEIQTLNHNLDEQGKKIDNIKDLIIQSSRGVRLPQK